MNKNIDTFDESKDFDRQMHFLEKIYTNEAPPSSASWADLRLRYAQTTTKLRRSTPLKWVSFYPLISRRFALIVAVITIVFVGTSVAYASGGLNILLRQLAGLERGTQSLASGEQFTAVNQQKTIAGVTVTLEGAYADSNRVILGLSLNQHDKQEFKHGAWGFDTIRLVTSDGTILSEGVAGAIAQQNGQATTLHSLDASKIQGSPRTLQLHAEISYSCQSFSSQPISATNGEITISSTNAAATPPAEQKNNAPPLESVCSQQAQTLSKQLHWSFDFSVPFHAGRVAIVNKSLSIQGRTVTLKRVVVTPSETRAYISGLPDTSIEHSTLSVDKQTYKLIDVPNGIDIQQVPVAASSSTYNPDGYLSFLVPLYDKHGQWMLNIKSAEDKTLGSFTFDVP